MYIPSKIDILKLFYRHPSFFIHILKSKLRFAERYQWAVNNFNSDDKVPPPLVFKLYLTMKCNLKCKMCMFYGDSGIYEKNISVAPTEELNWQIIEKIIQQNGDNHPSFVLSGGEALLYSKFRELAELLKEKKCFGYVCTNGLLLDRYIDVIEKNPYLIFYVSLDGTEMVNDEIRGKGVFKKVISNIKKLKALNKPPYIGLQFTLQPENVSDLYNTCKEVIPLGIDWFLINLRWYITEKQARNYENIMLQYFNTKPFNHLGFIASYDLDKEEFIKQCQKINAEKWPIQISSYLKKPEDIHKYVDNPEIPPYNNFCYKEWVRIDVLPNGDVTPCIQYPDLTFENLKNKSVMEIWNSDSFKNFRQFIRKQPLPICSRCYSIYLYDKNRKYL